MKLISAVLSAALVGSLAVAALPSTAQAKKPNSVMVGGPQVAWSALHLEYERKLVRKLSIGGFGTVGEYDPFSLRAVLGMWPVSIPLPGLRHKMLGARLNMYPLGGFRRGLMVGSTLRVGQFAGSSGVLNGSTEVDYTVSSTLLGAHLGFRVRLPFGMSLCALGGVGYHRFGTVQVNVNEVPLLKEAYDSQPSLLPYGTFNLGWDF